MAGNRHVEIEIDSDADLKGFVRTGIAADVLADRLDQVGDRARGSTRNLERFDRQLIETQLSMALLALEATRVSHVDAFKSLGDRKAIENVRAIRTEVANVGQTARRAGFEVDQLFDLGGVAKLAARNPEITAALVAGVAPALGAAVAAGVLLGVGGGALAGGIVAAAHDPAVRDAFAGLATEAGQGFKNASSVMVEPLQRAAGILRQDFADVLPNIRNVFSALSPEIERLAAGVGGFIREMAPGFERAAIAAKPLLETMATELPNLGAAIGGFFSLMETAGPGANAVFGDMLVTLEYIVGQVGLTVTALSLLYQFTEPPIFIALRALRGENEASIATWHGVAEAAALADKRLQELYTSADVLTRKLEGNIGTQFQLRSDLLSIQSATLAAATAFDTGGESIDTATEAGLRHREGLERGMDAIRRWRTDMLTAGQAPAYVNGEVEKMISTLIRDAQAHGADRAQTDALATSWRTILNLPSSKSLNTTITTTHREIWERIDAGNVVPGSGGQRIMAKGGIVAAAQGMITRSPTVLFGERRTGMEAFVPKLGITRDRAAGLLSTAANWHGFGLVDRQSGYASPVVSGGGGGGGNNYQISISVPPGVSPADVGAATVEAIKAFERLNGSNWRKDP